MAGVREEYIVYEAAFDGILKDLTTDQCTAFVKFMMFRLFRDDPNGMFEMIDRLKERL